MDDLTLRYAMMIEKNHMKRITTENADIHEVKGSHKKRMVAKL
jgi:peroxiredoxin